jgi:hypothetical protein
MLPILPALLLLILQGPSSIERMALEGRLPAALQAVTRQIESAEANLASTDDAEAAVWASLLAFSGDPELSGALIRLLSLDVSLPERSSGKAFEPNDWVDPPVFLSPDRASLPDAHVQCRRSRDGPC